MEPATTDKEIEIYQQKIVELNRLAEIGQLSAGILHEIKNPVSFVNNFSKLSQGLVSEIREITRKELSDLNKDDLADERELLETLSQNLLKINENGKRIERIIQGMLAQTRTDSPVLEPTDLNQLLEEYSKLAYQGVRGEDKEFNVMLKYDLDATVGNVNISRGEFGRVIVNLVNNACYAVNEKRKHGLEGYEPEIEIITRRLDPGIESGIPSGTPSEIDIRISDNGIGIPGEIVSKLFDAFFTTKPQGKGTGLGLSLTYSSIVDTHKGKISVSSVLGESTEFRIIIPA